MEKKKFLEYNDCKRCFIRRFHLLLKSLHPVDVYNQIYARYLETIGYQPHEYIDIKAYEAGLNLLLMSYFLLNEVNFLKTMISLKVTGIEIVSLCFHAQVKFNVNIPENVLFFDAKPLPLINPEEVRKNVGVSLVKKEQRILIHDFCRLQNQCSRQLVLSPIKLYP